MCDNLVGMDKICIAPRSLPFITGGEKAKDDSSIIVSSLNGYRLQPVSCILSNFHIYNFYPFIEIINFFRYFRIKNSIVFIQHPFSLGILNGGCLRIVARRNKIIILSHDLNSLRWNSKKWLKRERQQLKVAACIISLNKRYTEELRSLDLKMPIVELGVWDYLLPSCFTPKIHSFSKTVSFVGNLEKSEFIASWASGSHSYVIELIGNCSEKQKQEICANKNIMYKGKFTPNEVPLQLTGAFGLIWDGYSVESCDNGGEYGKYLKYNTPHKFSLYMAVGIPVFVWKGAAIAEFVLENGIGFVIDRLVDIDTILLQMTEMRYKALLEKIKPIQRKIVSGEYLHFAVKKAEQMIKIN